MNAQSTLGRNPRGSLGVTGQRHTTVSASGAPQPPGIDDRFADAKSAIIDIIKNTTWTSNSSEAKENLLQTVDNLENLPEDKAHLSAGEKEALDEYIGALEDVRGKLKEASETYGRKDSKKRDKIFKHSLAHLDRTGGIQVLETCRTIIETALKRLQNHHGTQPTAASTQTAPSSGQKNHAKADSRLSQGLTTARAIFTALEAFSGPIPIVGQYVGGTAKLGLAIIDMWKGMDSNADAAKSLESQMATLADHLKYFESQPSEDQKEETSKKIEHLQLQLKLVGEEIEALNSKGAFSKAFFSRDNAESLKGFLEQVKTAENELHRLISLDVKDIVKKHYAVTMNAEQRALLDRLGDGSYGAHGSTTKDATCLEGTREGILQRIDEWIEDPSSQRVLWIYGMAGQGKSTIAATVAHRWRDRSAWAVFHFRRGQTALEKRLVCSLAKQLGGRATPEFRRALLKAVGENEDIAQGWLDEQFKVLLANPLKDYPSESPPILLVADALDECEDIDYARMFVELIDEYSSSLPQNIKFVLTTRPEPPIVETLRSKAWRTENLDKITGTHDDVKLFIQSEFLKIKGLKPSLPANWPPQDSIQQLVALSEGLFQWARTAVKHIGSGSPNHRLDAVLKDSSKLQGLDNLYTQILFDAFAKAKEDSSVDLLHRVFATLVAAPDPISLDVIAYLCANQEALSDKTGMEACDFIRDDVLRNVASLLFIPKSASEPIRLMHASIRDLLIDPKRSGNSLYSVALPRAHWDLTQDCFRLMERDLEKNICNLSDLSMRNSNPYVQAYVTSKIHSGLKYSCQSWAAHLVAGNESDRGGKPKGIPILERFSTTKLLCWLEVMSLIGRVGNAIDMAKQTEQWIMVSLLVGRKQP
ncbi:hypothetical protein M407DRAFT_19280 [Tulasnella calospora MUT 4182]|uniref:NACHT domain-containing protein n=1 Tax=Tulasnella calospora MUT 4182 TaxID=1051891 RepID=A0A0C3QS91_9AGAM|nr:hypothetical protein M407DRAFT_19280 [Tulasnella calospora MUT 4182]